MGLEQLTWMVGSWAGEDGDGGLHEEVWLGSRGGIMLGLHRNLKPDSTVVFEYLRIEESADGLTYHSQTGFEPAISFPLRDVQENRVDFQRSFPDYPSAISYWIDGGTLCAAVEGIHRGRRQRIEWRWQSA